MSARLVAALLAVPLGLSGCSDAKAPNSANFRKVIEPLVADAYCQAMNPASMTVEGQPENQVFPVFLVAKSPMFDTGRADRATLEGLVGMGLVDRTEVTANARHAGTSEPMTRQALVRFEPTAKGRSHVRPIRVMKVSGAEGKAPAFCAGKGELVAVERWTEPADMFGQHVTQVTYSLRGTDPMDGMPEAARAKLGQARERTVPLVLMSDGWKVMTR